MENKNEFQQYVIGVMQAYLNYCLENDVDIKIFESHGAKYAIRNGLITHYASMHQRKDNGEFINLWQNVYNKTGKNKGINFCKHLLMSESAYKLLNTIVNIIKDSTCNINSAYKYRRSVYQYDNRKESKELLYWEHITPNNVIFEEIEKLYKRCKDEKSKIKATDVKNCFRNHKLVLLTNYEADYLNKKYRSKGTAVERMDCLFEIENFRLYLNGEIFEKKETLDKNDFIGKVKEYFDSDDFTIEC